MKNLIYLLLSVLSLTLTGCPDETNIVKKDSHNTTVIHVPASPTPTIPVVTPTVTPTIPQPNPLQIVAPTGVTTSSALLRGNINPNFVWGQNGYAEFQWGLEVAGGQANWDTSTKERLVGQPQGNVQDLVSSVLQPSARYVYRLVLNTGNQYEGTYYSDVQNFQTLASVPSTGPTGPTTTTTSTPPSSVATVQAFDPTGVTASSAVLRGKINYTWNSAGIAGFQWGRDLGVLDQQIDWANTTTAFVGHPVGNVQFSLQDQLRPGTAYIYRLFIAPGNGANAIPSDKVIHFVTKSAAKALAASEFVEGFAPSAKAKATDTLPTAQSIVVETQGVTNRGEDYATLHGFVDMPRNVTVPAVVFFQISLDNQTWDNWYFMGRTAVDETIAASFGGLQRDTTYYYRIGAGYSPDNSVYGRSRSFKTLASSDTRGELLNNIGQLAQDVSAAVAQAKQLLLSSSIVPKVVQIVSQSYIDALVKGQILLELSASPEVDGAISEDLARKIISASDEVDALRSTSNDYFAKVYRVEFTRPYSTFDVPQTPDGLGKMAAGDLKSVAAKMVGRVAADQENVQIPNDVLLDILSALVDGTNTLADRSKEAIYGNYNADAWTESFASYLANKAFVSARVLHDLTQIPEVSDLIDANLRSTIKNLDNSVKALRTDMRKMQGRANSSSRFNSLQSSSDLQRRYIDGEPIDEGMGKAR